MRVPHKLSKFSQAAANLLVLQSQQNSPTEPTELQGISGYICLSQSIAASQHPFEVLLATPERCEVETPTFARVVIALELEATQVIPSRETCFEVL